MQNFDDVATGLTFVNFKSLSHFILLSFLLNQLIEQPGSFSRHARESGHPGHTLQLKKRLLDSRLRGNDKGAIKKLPDPSTN
jgi:hypothetical protein